MKLNDTKGNKSVTNRAGGESFETDTPELQLYKLTVNNLLEDTYYRSDREAFDELLTAAAHSDPEFILKMAAYARQELYLRDVPIVLLVWASRFDPAKNLVPEYAEHVISRADEPMKAIATHEKLFGPPTFKGRAKKWASENGMYKGARIEQALENGNVKEIAEEIGVYDSIQKEGVCLSTPLQDGIENALHNFDTYQISKYDTDRREYNMKDVLNLVRPKPRDDLRSEIFERVALGERRDDIEPLEPPETWEVVISEKGNTREAWESVLPKMGLFARIRNVRNMLEAGVPAEKIIRDYDVGNVKDSKIYPFRFYQAWKNSPENPEIKMWLTDLISESLGNINLPDSYVCVDVSASMRCGVSGNSSLTCREISAFFGAVMSYSAKKTCVFATDVDNMIFHETDDVFTRMTKILESPVGGATNGWKAIDEMQHMREPPNRIIMLTDMQIWDSQVRSQNSVRDSYHRLFAKPPIYMVDLASYGDLTFPEGTENVYNISGWNEKIIDFIRISETSNPLDEIWAFEP